MKYFFSLVVFSILLVIAEIFLKLFFPFTFGTIGHVFSKNADLYGWGFNPHQIIKIRDPDTGDVYIGRSNNHGWRDRNRTFSNHKKSYRILVLGDSFTFGAVVPAEKVYTRILENRLQENGFNVEVINISYGGWGTDQQLEALKNEGLKYKPQLVIIQFHLNDLRENMYFTHGNDRKKSSKPFYYTVDDNGHLIRHKNPFFMKKWNWKDEIKFHILKFEIGKRLYHIYFTHKWNETPMSHSDENSVDDQTRRAMYFASQNQIEQLELALNLDSEGQLHRYLSKNVGKEIDVYEVINLIENSSHRKDKDRILRVLEKRAFHRNWSRKSFLPKKQDINSPHWRLYFALINEVNSLLTEKGAKMVIFCHSFISQYQWNVNWCRISNDANSRKNFLQYPDIIRQYAKNHEIDYIENRRPYQFARNDPHPNSKGNEAMAEDIYDYLLENHIEDLKQYPLTHSSEL